VKAQSKKQFNEAESPELDQPSSSLSALSFQLKIGYDGKRATNNLTGLGNYSRSLIEHLAVQFPANEYLVYTPKKRVYIRNLPVFEKTNVHVILPKEGKSKLFWRSFGIKDQLKKDKIDLFHGLSHEIPFGIQQTRIKSIVTIHDLIFLRWPQYYKFIDRSIYKLKSKYACKHADRIIAISERTKQDIVELYGTDPAKIDVIYQSCDDSFKSEVPSAEKNVVREKYQLPEKYLLNVGTIEARKNLLQLIKALPQIDSSYPLVVVGKATKYFDIVNKEIEKLGLQHRVIFLKNLPYDSLPAIYQMATAFILPSFYEGFGIPIIEALYGKVPVIAAKGSCLEEAGGPDSLYFSPHQVNELAETINLVLSDIKLRELMKMKGFEYVQKFNNTLVNEQLMNCYLKTLAQRTHHEYTSQK
jgi:glycosyltransferase involved in cell wall biosynthesis